MVRRLLIGLILCLIPITPALAEIEDFTTAEDYSSLAYLYQERADELETMIHEHERITDSSFFQKHPEAQTEMQLERYAIIEKGRLLLAELKHAAAYHKAKAKTESAKAPL